MSKKTNSKKKEVKIKELELEMFERERKNPDSYDYRKEMVEFSLQVRKIEASEKVKSYCKPCWELNYCPYGGLVEFFPLYNEYTNLEHLNELYDDLVKKFLDGNIQDEDELWAEIQRLFYLEPSSWEIASLLDPILVECHEFGHFCPVFFTKSVASETREKRLHTRHIPRDMMFAVIRRDDYHCQDCGKRLYDQEIEFDHIIPYSKGGPTTVDNLRILCRECNRKKSDSMEHLLRK